MGQAARNPFEVRRGFRGVQVEKLIRARQENGEPWPSYGELMRELDFYDRAGAYRALKRLRESGTLNNNTPGMKIKP